jgi:hypothetical protein
MKRYQNNFETKWPVAPLCEDQLKDINPMHVLNDAILESQAIDKVLEAAKAWEKRICQEEVLMGLTKEEMLEELGGSNNLGRLLTAVRKLKKL